MDCNFAVMPLPYGYDALEPYIEEDIIKIHHDVLYRRYVERLNATLEKYPEYCEYSLEEIILNIEYFPQEIQVPVFHTAGGVYNHQIYFESMQPAPSRKPEGRLADAINQSLGSFQEFQEAFIKQAMEVFGSGYTWLVINHLGLLEIASTANQTTALTLNMYPLVGIDLWEHSYFCQYSAERRDYIQAWFQVANWQRAEERYMGL